MAGSGQGLAEGPEDRANRSESAGQLDRSTEHAHPERLRQAPEVAEAIPLEPAALQQIVRVVHSEIRHRGPIPDPATLRGYEDVQPGFAERIMAMAEREQQHRHDMDRTDATQAYRLASRGQVLALVALGIMASLAITLAVIGQPVWAAVVGGIDVAAVVGVFIGGQRQSSEEQSSSSSPGRDERGRTPLEPSGGEGGGVTPPEDESSG